MELSEYELRALALLEQQFANSPYHDDLRVRVRRRRRSAHLDQSLSSYWLVALGLALIAVGVALTTALGVGVALLGYSFTLVPSQRLLRALARHRATD
jgi:Flp pilus assembly protein TadB